MITSSNGIKIGLIGLVEREWLESVNALPPNLVYRDSVDVANELIPGLREQGAQIVIVLAHQREYHDNRLAQDTPAYSVGMTITTAIERFRTRMFSALGATSNRSATLR